MCDHGLHGDLFDASTLHITLCEAGDPRRVREDALLALKKAGAMVKQSTFEVTLDNAIGFHGGSHNFPCVLAANHESSGPLTELRDKIRFGQLSHGIKPSFAKKFVPHMTFLRADSHWSYQGKIGPITWLADEFLLINSHREGEIWRHEVWGRWSLQSSA